MGLNIEPDRDAPLVIYHRACSDGLVAAWVCLLKYPDAELWAAQYGEAPPPPELVAGRDVLIVDFSYDRETLVELKAAAHTLVVLDHHKTAQGSLRGLPWAIFDMDRSGARIAWDFLHGDPEAPWVVNYAQDFDLWRFQLPHSRAINAAINSWPRDLEGPNREVWARAIAVGSVPARIEGEAILRFQRMLIDRLTRWPKDVEIAPGVWAQVVNAPVLQSEVCHALIEAGHKVACAYSVGRDGLKRVSIRSAEDGPDVSEIAARFGGGGHRHSAGFKVPL